MTNEEILREALTKLITLMEKADFLSCNYLHEIEEANKALTDTEDKVKKAVQLAADELIAMPREQIVAEIDAMDTGREMNNDGMWTGPEVCPKCKSKDWRGKISEQNWRCAVCKYEWPHNGSAISASSVCYACGRGKEPDDEAMESAFDDCCVAYEDARGDQMPIYKGFFSLGWKSACKWMEGKQ